MRYVFMVLAGLLLTACPQAQTQNNIKFEVKNFELKYEETRMTYVKSESYTGKGTIIATGDPSVVKKPYIVLLKITRTSGGLETNTQKEQKAQVLVDDGIGEFMTFDYTSENKHFSKPEYKIDVIGFVPFTAINTAQAK